MSEPYTTSDTSLAAWLHYKGHKLVGFMQDPYDNSRKIAVLVKRDDTGELEREYLKPVTINLRHYYKSIRAVHYTLREGREIKK